MMGGRWGEDISPLRTKGEDSEFFHNYVIYSIQSVSPYSLPFYLQDPLPSFHAGQNSHPISASAWYSDFVLYMSSGIYFWNEDLWYKEKSYICLPNIHHKMLRQGKDNGNKDFFLEKGNSNQYLWQVQNLTEEMSSVPTLALGNMPCLCFLVLAPSSIFLCSP